MTFVVEVENIKCGGCANTISKRLRQIEGVTAAEVDTDTGKIQIQGPDSARSLTVSTLAGLGYPEKGSVEGMRSLAAKAKSFASCAVGRISNDDSS